MAESPQKPDPPTGKVGNMWLWLALLFFPAGLLLLLFALPFMPVKKPRS